MLQGAKMTSPNESAGEDQHLPMPTGSTYVRTIGQGKPMIIVHGGPGLEHSYLFDWLRPLSRVRTLLFYDQLGSGRDSTPLEDVTSAALVCQLKSIIDKYGGTDQVGLFAHSWGSYLALSVLRDEVHSKIEELVLCNPFPLTSSRFAESGARLMERIPADVKLQIEDLDQIRDDAAGLRLMEVALPYYLGQIGLIPDLCFASYSIAVNEKVFGDIGDFDLTDTGPLLPRRSLLIYGEKDFIIEEDSKELQLLHAEQRVIDGAGHFPFAENPTRFTEATLSFLDQPG